MIDSMDDHHRCCRSMFFRRARRAARSPSPALAPIPVLVPSPIPVPVTEVMAGGGGRVERTERGGAGRDKDAESELSDPRIWVKNGEGREGQINLRKVKCEKRGESTSCQWLVDLCVCEFDVWTIICLCITLSLIRDLGVSGSPCPDEDVIDGRANNEGRPLLPPLVAGL